MVKLKEIIHFFQDKEIHIKIPTKKMVENCGRHW